MSKQACKNCHLGWVMISTRWYKSLNTSLKLLIYVLGGSYVLDDGPNFCIFKNESDCIPIIMC